MNDLFLKFADQSEMHSLLEPLNMVYTDEENTPRLIQGGHQYALWEVGEIPGVDGWHLNLRVIDPEFDVSSLEPYRVYPSTPACVWA